MSAQALNASEHELKAAFLYNFAKFVEWPADAAETAGLPLVLGIFDPSPFGPVLATIGGKTAQGRGIVVKACSKPADATACHIVFLNVSDEAQIRETLALVRETSVLTVGEADQFTVWGGIVRFYAVGKRLRFEINVAAAELAGLRISSKLLKLAKIFRRGTETGPGFKAKSD